ncbi:hypothetical protein OH76DRAFT_1301319, partial [Lentinus brumalis]
GAGIYFGPGSSSNCALRVRGCPARSRAIILATVHVVHSTPPNLGLQIYTTDDYLPRSVCHWASHNERRNWSVPYGRALQGLAMAIHARSAPVTF